MSKKENHKFLLPEHVKAKETYPVRLILFCLAISCITSPFYLGILRKLSKAHQSGKTENSLSYFSIEGASVIIFFLGVVLLLAMFFHYVFTYDKNLKINRTLIYYFFFLGLVLTVTFSSSYIFDRSSLGFIGSVVLFISFIMFGTIVYKNIFEIGFVAFDNFVELEKEQQLTISLSLITFILGLLIGK